MLLSVREEENGGFPVENGPEGNVFTCGNVEDVYAGYVHAQQFNPAPQAGTA